MKPLSLPASTSIFTHPNSYYNKTLPLPTKKMSKESPSFLEKRNPPFFIHQNGKSLTPLLETSGQISRASTNAATSSRSENGCSRPRASSGSQTRLSIRTLGRTGNRRRRSRRALRARRSWSAARG